MESRAKLLGHPVHPLLVAFPLGLLVTAVIFDVIRLVTGVTDFDIAAYWCIAGGVGGGVAAAVFGLWDWAAIPASTRAKRIGAWHGAGNAIALALFAVSWWLRAGSTGYTPGVAAFVLSLAAGIMAVTGWLGGELVHRLGVGADPGANLDAPSSLAAPPADAADDASGIRTPGTRGARATQLPRWSGW
jgi:uncharacterized membrane protein